MNTIPTIFNERKVAHTIVGGAIKKSDEEIPPFTVILLNRGGRYYRSAVFQNLENAGFTSVISIEMSNEPYDIENLSIRFPCVKFLVPLDQVTVGEMINTAMAETASPWVFVLWNDVRISISSISQRLINRICEDGFLCTAPILSSQKMEALPVQMVPALNKNNFQVEPMPCLRDSSPSIYPFDYIGVYNRDKFIKLGGFDYTITNSYWQNLDFGFRSHLWGEKIILSTSFRLTYDAEVPQEDITPDASYRYFYLKNLAPVFHKDEGVLPRSRFVPFALRSGMTFFDSVSAFSRVRKWIHLNRFRFVRDAADITKTWEPYLQ